MNQLNLNINPNLKFAGKWRISVVDKARDSSFYPFGESMRDNLILNQGKHAIAGSDGAGGTPQFGKSLSDLTCLADLIAGNAYVGTSANPATPNNTGILGTSYVSSSTTPNYSCTTADNLSTGSRTFTRSWDFPPVSSDVDLNEACIESSNCTTNFKFSRFVFPATVTLESGQFLRLEYSLTIQINAIVSSINISLSSGDFIGDGEMRLVGTFNNIFGNINSLGAVNTRAPYGPGRGYFPIHACPNGQYSGACMVSDFNPSLAISFPAAGSPPNISMTTGTSRIDQSNKAAIITYSPATFTKSCRYTFVAGNPYATTNIGGIMFSSQATSYLSWGWLWKFNALQSKDALKSVSVVLNQTVL